MVRSDRWAALFLDAVFVGILPFGVSFILDMFLLEDGLTVLMFTLIGSALVIGETMLHATIGMFLTGQRIVSLDGRAASGWKYALRAIIKYLPYLLIWPAYMIHEGLAVLCAILLILLYPLLLAAGNGLSMLSCGETLFDRLLELTVVPLPSAAEAEPRGFDPIAIGSPRPVEPATEDADIIP